MVWERTQAAIQDLVDEAAKAKEYYSDALDAYDRLWYHFGRYEVSVGKSETVCLLLQSSPVAKAKVPELPGPCFSINLDYCLATPNIC